MKQVFLLGGNEVFPWPSQWPHSEGPWNTSSCPFIRSTPATLRKSCTTLFGKFFLCLPEKKKEIQENKLKSKCGWRTDDLLVSPPPFLSPVPTGSTVRRPRCGRGPQQKLSACRCGCVCPRATETAGERLCAQREANVSPGMRASVENYKFEVMCV